MFCFKSSMFVLPFYNKRMYMYVFPRPSSVKPPAAMSLRTRGHEFLLAVVRYEFNKKNFIVRAV